MTRRGDLDVAFGLLPDLNLYQSVNNNPNSYIDPDGRSIKSACELFYVTPAVNKAINDYKDAERRLNKKYGPGKWPDPIEDYMDKWKKDLLKRFGRDVADPIIRTTPGTTPKGRPVVRPRGL